MSLRSLNAVLWLLAAAFAALSTGQNVSTMVPPVYNATDSESGATATSFNLSSGVPEPSTSFQVMTELPVEATELVRAAQTTPTPTVMLVTTSQPEVTGEPQRPSFAETFVLPEVDGLVGGELRSSMKSATTPFEDRTVTPDSETGVTADTFIDSTTLGARASDASTILLEKSPAEAASTVAVTSNPDSERGDFSFFASLFPELDLFDPNFATTPDGVQLPASTPSGDSPTVQPPSGYNMSKERYCIAARFCYKELNERCVMRHMKSVCGCGRAFFRNPETLVCERKLPLLVSLELPEHSYVQEVADKKSLEFKAYESAAQHLMWGLVRISPLLAKAVIDIEVTGFRPGLLVRSRLVVASSFVHKLSADVSGALHREFRMAIDDYKSTESFLRTRNMRTVAADVAVNPCDDRDSNYCSPYAICTYRKQDYGMSCRCLPGFQDVSPDTGHHPGELCFSICEPGHCHNNGTCTSTGFGVECECRDWYVGNKCQFQMKRIIIIVVVVAAVLLTAVGVAFHKYWRKGRLQHCSNQVCRMLIVEPAKRSSSKRPLDPKLAENAVLPHSPGIPRSPACVSPNSVRSVRSAFSGCLEENLSHVTISVVSK
uniref:Putative interphotoreceptor matrix proteoglycan 2 n=1 Tax=Amblyomma parvum TaxID=251391 RepID=A0A023G2P8_AMBPA